MSWLQPFAFTTFPLLGSMVNGHFANKNMAWYHVSAVHVFQLPYAYGILLYTVKSDVHVFIFTETGQTNLGTAEISSTSVAHAASEHGLLFISRVSRWWRLPRQGCTTPGFIRHAIGSEPGMGAHFPEFPQFTIGS